MGTLYCYDRILKLNPKNVLEVGVGLKNFFDINIGQKCNLFTLDDDRFYDSDKFKKAVEQRKNTTHIPGYLGDDSSDKLPNSFFDILFSISVLEHIPEQNIPIVFAEMGRTVRKGGWMFSSIDMLGLDAARTLIPAMKEALAKNGFLTSEPNIIWSAEDTEAVLTEPLSIVYNYYYRKRDNPWQNTAFVKDHAVTYLVSAYKI